MQQMKPLIKMVFYCIDKMKRLKLSKEVSSTFFALSLSLYQYSLLSELCCLSVWLPLVYTTGDRHHDVCHLVAGLNRCSSPRRSPVVHTRGDCCSDDRRDGYSRLVHTLQAIVVATIATTVAAMIVPCIIVCPMLLCSALGRHIRSLGAWRPMAMSDGDVRCPAVCGNRQIYKIFKWLYLEKL